MSLFDDDSPIENPFEGKLSDNDYLRILKEFERSEATRRMEFRYRALGLLFTVIMGVAGSLLILLVFSAVLTIAVATLTHYGTRAIDGNVALPALSFGLAFSAFPRAIVKDWSLPSATGFHASGLAMMIGAMMAIFAYGLAWSVEHSPITQHSTNWFFTVVWQYAIFCLLIGCVVWFYGFTFFLLVMANSFREVVMSKHPGHPDKTADDPNQSGKPHEAP